MVGGLNRRWRSIVVMRSFRPCSSEQTREGPSICSKPIRHNRCYSSCRPTSSSWWFLIKASRWLSSLVFVIAMGRWEQKIFLMNKKSGKKVTTTQMYSSEWWFSQWYPTLERRCVLNCDGNSFCRHVLVKCETVLKRDPIYLTPNVFLTEGSPRTRSIKWMPSFLIPFFTFMLPIKPML